MFVRWKRRRLRRSESEYVFYAVLVKSIRKGEKPQQKYIRHLAHIKEKYLWATAHKDSFWEHVDWHLKDLRLESALSRKIKSQLLKKVSRPTKQELKELEKSRKFFRSSPL